MNPRIPSALLSVGLVVASVLVPTAAASAAETDDVTWTVRTASNDLGDDRTSYSYGLEPGQTVSDGLVIANRGEEDLTLAVYAADGYTTESGQFDIDTLDEQGQGIGAWTGVVDDGVTVEAGQTVTVPFTVTVPADATPGDYAGGIVTSLAQEGDQPGVSVDRRLGIRMAVRVAGDLTPSLAVGDVQVDWDGGWNPFAGGDATVSYTIENTGNTIIAGAQGASVAGPFGWFPTDAVDVPEPPQLLPGESWRQSVTIPDVASLVLLTATATVVPNSLDASGSTSALSPVVATGTGWAVPWTILIVLVLIVLAAVLVPRLLRERRSRRQAAEDARVQEAVSRALESVGADG